MWRACAWRALTLSRARGPRLWPQPMILCSRGSGGYSGRRAGGRENGGPVCGGRSVRRYCAAMTWPCMVTAKRLNRARAGLPQQSDPDCPGAACARPTRAFHRPYNYRPRVTGAPTSGYSTASTARHGGRDANNAKHPERWQPSAVVQTLFNGHRTGNSRASELGACGRRPCATQSRHALERPAYMNVLRDTAPRLHAAKCGAQDN